TSRILGVARSKDSDEAYRANVKEAVQRAVKDADPQVLEKFLGLVHYFGLDATQDPGWDEFAANLKAHDGKIRVFYLSTSPSLIVGICERLRSHGLNGDGARVVIEKPIGNDLASATRINDEVGSVFSEKQAFRIDHYLGKETVQNL